ncbi:MAG: hypothetical protein U1F43_15330 [Myxococcota bacterium]
MKLWILGGAMLAMASGGSALAAPPDPVERAGDRQALREDTRETVGDRWDKARLEALLAEYAKARRARKVPVITELDQRFMGEIRAEVAESRVETGEKAHELGQSAMERNGERHEVVKDVVLGHPVKAVRDAHDLRDDRRDTRDDRRDLVAEEAALQRKKAIRDAFQAQLGHFDARAVLAKESLIKKAIAEAALEVRVDVREKAEDRRELREDRRDDRRPD